MFLIVRRRSYRDIANKIKEEKLVKEFEDYFDNAEADDDEIDLLGKIFQCFHRSLQKSFVFFLQCPYSFQYKTNCYLILTVKISLV